MSDLHPIRIEGKVTLSDGSETSFSIEPGLGWQQWGNITEKLGTTGDMMDAFAVVADEHGLAEVSEDDLDENGEEQEPREASMDLDEARAALEAGKRIRIVVGSAERDPTIVIWLDDGMVMSESIAGWSAGVVEPVCSITSDVFLEGFLRDRLSIDVLSPDREVVAVRTADAGGHTHVIGVKLADGTIETSEAVMAAMAQHDAHYVMRPPEGSPAYQAHQETGLPLLLQTRPCPDCGKEVLFA